MVIPVRTETVRSNVPGGKGHTRGIIGAGQGIYEASVAPKHLVGDRLPLWGGRVFYYASFEVTGDLGDATTANVAGYLVAPDASSNDLVETDNVVCDVGTDTSKYPPTAGQRKVEITKTSITKNMFEDGTLHITDDAGEGYTYLIRRNSATGEKLNQNDPALASTSSFILELYDGLVIALDTDTDFAIVGNMFANLTPATAGTDMNVIGVSMLAIDVSDKPYAWVQTWGPATVLFDEDAGAIVKGDMVQLGGDEGSCQRWDAYTEVPIGYALHAPDDEGHCCVFLQMVP